MRFKRINYNNEVQRTVYQRMIAERTRIAERFRSEGLGESARIRGEGRGRLEVASVGIHEGAGQEGRNNFV